MKLYHGSTEIVKEPSLNKGKSYNDYGRGFYCTFDKELAKEWAAQKNRPGFVNVYELDLDKLNVLDLRDEHYSVLNWVAFLLANRTFDNQTSLLDSYRKQFLDKYLLDKSKYDVIIGYRADDSYFAYASAFLTNSIPLSILEKALVLGDLGIQIVLISPKAFDSIKYVDKEEVDNIIYYPKFFSRDYKARKEYRKIISKTSLKKNDVFVLDLLRGNKK